MSTNETDRGAQGGEDLKESPEGHIGNFKHSTPQAIDLLLRLPLPAGTAHRDVTAFFDNRTTWQAVRDWRRGKSKPPAWAVDIVRRWYADRAALCSRVPVSSGRENCIRNLRQYQAKKNAAR